MADVRSVRSDQMTDDQPAPDSAPTRPGRDLAWLSIPLVVNLVVATIGSYTAHTFIEERPELALALSSRPRHLLLSVPAGITLAAFVAIAVVRLSAPLPFAYVLGKRYGGRGLAWLEKETGGNTGYVGFLQRLFRRFSIPTVMVFPNMYIGIFAGVEQMPLRRYVPATIVGLAARLGFYWWAGNQFSDELEDVLDLIQRFQWPLLIGLVVLAMAQGAWRQSAPRSGRPPRGRLR